MRHVDSIAFDTNVNDELEREFPIAFLFLAHHQPAVFEMFMASSYRPGDAVCVHIDRKTSKEDAEVRLRSATIRFCSSHVEFELQ